jgi:hypothetical protein
MKATGTFTKQNGEVFIINDYQPSIPLAEAKEMYKTGRLGISKSCYTNRVMLERLLK